MLVWVSFSLIRLFLSFIPVKFIILDGLAHYGRNALVGLSAGVWVGASTCKISFKIVSIELPVLLLSSLIGVWYGVLFTAILRGRLPRSK